MAGDDTAYSVKELILRLDVKVDRLFESLNDKAPTSEVVDLKTRVTILETQSKTTQFILFRAVPATLAIASVVAAFVR